MSDSPNFFSKNDISVFDNAKGVAIILIFLCHAGQPLSHFLTIMVPLFAFASGFAFKNGNLSSYTKKAFSLYILGNILYLPGVWLAAHSPAFQTSGFLPPKDISLPLLVLGPNNGILWYLPALIIWACCSRFVLGFKHPLILTFLLISLLSYALSLAEFTEKTGYWGYIIFWHVKLATKMFLFFFLGMITPWEIVVKARRSPLKFISLPIAIVLMITLNDKNYTPTNPDFWQAPIYLVACAICTFTVIVFLPGKRLRYLTDIGKASLNIYLLHIWICGLLAIYPYKKTTPGYNIAAVLLVITCCILLSSRKVLLFFNNATNALENTIFQKEKPQR